MASKFQGKGKSKGRVSAFAKAAAKSEPKQPEGDLFDPGKYRVGFVDCSEGENGALCVKLAGRGNDEEIGERIQWFSTAGKAIHVSAPRIKSLCMALLGCADADEYSEFDPHGEFINAIVPFDTDAAAAYLVEAGKAKNAKAALALIAEAEFGIKVSKGGERGDGGFFRNASFYTLDGEDDSDDDDSEDEDEEPESERKPAKKKASKRRPVEEDDEDEDADDEDDDDSEDDEDEEPESERPARRAKASKKAKGRK